MPEDIDPYLILGLSPDAGPDAIEAAWRRAVHDTHPDRHPDDPTAAGRLQAVLSAGHILRDPARRAAHDAARTPRPADRADPPTWTRLAWDGAGARRRARG